MQEQFKAIIENLNKISTEQLEERWAKRVSDFYESKPKSMLYRAVNFSKVSSFGDKDPIVGPREFETITTTDEELNSLSIANITDENENLNHLNFNVDLITKRQRDIAYNPVSFTLKEYNQAVYKSIIFCKGISYSRKVSACPVIEELIEKLFGKWEDLLYEDTIEYCFTPSARFVSSYKSKDILEDRLTFLEALLTGLSGNFNVLHTVIAFLYHGKDKVVAPHPKIALLLNEIMLSHGDKPAFLELVYLNDYYLNNFNINNAYLFTEYATIAMKANVIQANMLMYDLAHSYNNYQSYLDAQNEIKKLNINYQQALSKNLSPIENAIVKFLDFENKIGVGTFSSVLDADLFQIASLSKKSDCISKDYFEEFLLSLTLLNETSTSFKQDALNNVFIKMPFFDDKNKAIVVIKLFGRFVESLKNYQGNREFLNDFNLDEFKSVLTFLVNNASSKYQILYLNYYLNEFLGKSLETLIGYKLSDEFDNLDDKEILFIGALYLNNLLSIDEFNLLKEQSYGDFFRSIECIKTKDFNKASELLKACAIDGSENSMFLLSELVINKLVAVSDEFVEQIYRCENDVLDDDYNVIADYDTEYQDIFRDYNYIFRNIDVYLAYKLYLNA